MGVIMKKIIVTFIVIVCAFVLIIVFQKPSQQIESATEHKTNNLYKNEISLKKLQTYLKNQEELTVYFYQTSCSHCKKVTPIVIPMAQKLKIDLKLINLENYSETGWDEFNIDATPTIVHFKNGREDKRIVGELTEKAYELWFKSIKE